MAMAEKDQVIERLQIEVERLGSQVGELTRKAEDRLVDECKITDQRLHYESSIDKKEGTIASQREEIVKLKDDIKGKDEALNALSQNIIEKAEKNQLLTEQIAEMKNHQLSTSYLNQSYLVQKITKKGPIDLLVTIKYGLIPCSFGSYPTRPKSTTSSSRSETKKRNGRKEST